PIQLSQESSATPAAGAPELAGLGDLRAVLAALEDPGSQAVAIDWLHELEGLKSVAAAAQAKITAALAQLGDDQERAQGVVKSRRGKGLAAEVALARGDAPPKGTKHLQLAEALTQDLPNTMEALAAGVIHEDHAQVVSTETASMSAAGRRKVDARLAGRFAGLGPRKLGEIVRGHVHELDHAGAVTRHEQARAQRRVTLRPTTAGMAQLTGVLPLHQAAAIHDTLQKAALSRVSAGDTTDADGQARTTDQPMADLLVEQVTHQTTPSVVPAEIQVVMTDTALFGDDATPAWVPGHGHIPAAIAKHWLADPDTALRLRRLYTRP